MKYLLLLSSAALFACNHGSKKQPATPDGSLLGADDASDTIRKVSKE